GLRPCRDRTISPEATMASLELRSERYRLIFRYGGRKFQYALKTTDQKEAEGCLARLEENLRLLERGRLQLPPDADLPTFLLSDGKVTTKPQITGTVLTLEELFKQYVEVHSNGALERNSLDTVEMHIRHLCRTLGGSFAVVRLRQNDLQSHLN